MPICWKFSIIWRTISYISLWIWWIILQDLPILTLYLHIWFGTLYVLASIVCFLTYRLQAMLSQLAYLYKYNVGRSGLALLSMSSSYGISYTSQDTEDLCRVVPHLWVALREAKDVWLPYRHQYSDFMSRTLQLIVEYCSLQVGIISWEWNWQIISGNIYLENGIYCWKIEFHMH